MWFIAAISAAVFWGLSYALSEKVLKSGIYHATLLAVSSCVALPVYVGLTAKQGAISKQISLIKTTPHLAGILLLIVTLYISANFLIFYAIQQKNATVVNLIEIAYPLFTALFAWVLYRNVQMNWGIAVGAVLILCGITCVIVFSKSEL